MTAGAPSSSTLRPPEGRKNTADIIGIGAQRAMTSWLHRVLSAHPGSWSFPDCSPLTSTNKEAHYWTRNHHRGPDWYRVLMTPPERRERLTLDITPDYALLDPAQIAECHALSPGAQVIFILRDPLARALSALRMHSLWDSGHAPAEALRLELDDATRARMKRARLRQMAGAAGQLRRWRAAYPDMLVLNYETLAADPLASALGILTACGLDPDAMPPEARDELERRVAERVWQTPGYAVSPDLLHLLHGMTWQARRDIEAETGFQFNEMHAILDSASEAAA